jgi:hypothetical protein
VKSQKNKFELSSPSPDDLKLKGGQPVAVRYFALANAKKLFKLYNEQPEQLL